MVNEKTPTWIENFRTIYLRYGGGLSMMGFSGTDIGVYVYLFTQKWFENKSRFVSFEISKTLSPIVSLIPNEYRTSVFSEKAVSKSLKKLVTLGFVNEIPNTSKISNGGRAAKAHYEVTKVIDLTKTVEGNFKEYQNAVSNTLSKFAAIEEGITLKEVGSRGETDD